MTKKIIQWYIARIDDKFVSNYFPHNTTTDYRATLEDLESKKDHLFRYGFLTEAKHHTWQNYTEETECRIIGEHEIKKEEALHIFPIRFRNMEDQMFKTYKNWPFHYLHDHIIQWLREHYYCRILFHDAHESKGIHALNFLTIPGLAMMRDEYQLPNRFIYANCQSNPSCRVDLMTNHPGTWTKPYWLDIAGSNHWLQFNYSDEFVIWSKFRKPKAPKTIDEWLDSTPDFETGRFLFYGGRLRLSRTYLLQSIFESNIPIHRIFARLWGLNYTGHREDKIKETIPLLNMMGTLEKDKHRANIPNPYTLQQIESIAKFGQNVPIDTFPEHMAENVEHYMDTFWNHWPNPDHYKHIFVDISPETFAERASLSKIGTVFLTEKTMKSVYACRPMITLGNQGHIAHMQKLGFKTFNRWWDESYDDDVDIHTAVQRITNVVKEINSWDTAKCRKVYEEMKPVLIHNHNHLLWIANDAPRSWLEGVRISQGMKTMCQLKSCQWQI